MINVTYETRYDGETAPKICKIVSAEGEPSGSEIVTNLTLSNSDEIENVSNEELWEHMNNLVDFLKVKSADLSLVDQSIYPEEGWPAVGWAYLSTLNDEITQWWVYVSRRDSAPETQVLHYH
jgi:hypothetical protein